MALALEAYSLAIRIGFAKGEAESLNRIGNTYYNFGNYLKAMEVFFSSDLITGAIAAIALPPQIAVPHEIK